MENNSSFFCCFVAIVGKQNQPNIIKRFVPNLFISRLKSVGQCHLHANSFQFTCFLFVRMHAWHGVNQNIFKIEAKIAKILLPSTFQPKKGFGKLQNATRCYECQRRLRCWQKSTTFEAHVTGRRRQGFKKSLGSIYCRHLLIRIDLHFWSSLFQSWVKN